LTDEEREALLEACAASEWAALVGNYEW